MRNALCSANTDVSVKRLGTYF